MIFNLAKPTIDIFLVILLHQIARSEKRLARMPLMNLLYNLLVYYIFRYLFSVRKSNVTFFKEHQVASSKLNPAVYLDCVESNT